MSTTIQKREIFHFLFLQQLLKISDPRLYVLKGGVNLRFFFQSPRYSEDMDLDVRGGSVQTLKKNGYKILNDAALRRTLATFGIVDLVLNDPTKAKQTDTTQRFRFRLVTESGEILPTKIEFSRRKKKATDAVELALIQPEMARRYKRVSYTCQHYSGEAAFAQKIEALAGRSVTQARDVFDLYLLHASGYGLSLQKIKPNLIKQARTNLKSLSFADYQGQVVEFLAEEARSQFESQAQWQNLLQTLGSVMA